MLVRKLPVFVAILASLPPMRIGSGPSDGGLDRRSFSVEDGDGVEVGRTLQQRWLVW